MPDNRLSRAVPFDVMGPDCVLRFTTADLIALEEFCAVEGPEDTWTAAIERKLKVSDAVFIREAIRLGLKAPGGFARPEGVDYDDLPTSPAAAVGPIGDAIFCAISGKAYADLVAERKEAEAVATAALEQASIRKGWTEPRPTGAVARPDNETAA